MSESGEHPGEHVIAGVKVAKRIWTTPYRVITSGGRQGILCLFCDSLSWNMQDVRNIYCGKCRTFLGEEG